MVRSCVGEICQSENVGTMSVQGNFPYPTSNIPFSVYVSIKLLTGLGAF